MNPNNLVKFSINEANAKQIIQHLKACDLTFIPPLSERVEIKDYAQKLTHRSMRFEAWGKNSLVGLVAIYCNNQETATAYITNVSVISKWQGRGIASQLIESCIAYITKQDFVEIQLEVDLKNFYAINLYKKHGFIVNNTNHHCLTMSFLIDKAPNLNCK